LLSVATLLIHTFDSENIEPKNEREEVDIFKTISTAMMIAPTKRVYVSPTSAVQEARRQWESKGQCEGMVEVTGRFVSYPQNQEVRFSDQVSVVIGNSNLTEALVQELWFSRQEIQGFHKEAKQQAKDFRGKHSELVQELGTLVRTFTKVSSLSPQALFRSPGAEQIMKSWPDTTARGLEGHLHAIFGRYRVLHRQGLLRIQKCCPKKHDATFLEQLLRSRSQYTSRASRAFARLLAHGDALHMAAIIRQELRELNEDIVLVD
jgi:hypothetical protein